MDICWCRKYRDSSWQYFERKQFEYTDAGPAPVPSLYLDSIQVFILSSRSTYVQAMDNPNATTTRLLTLLNVSAVKTGKRKCTFDDSAPVPKLNKRKSVLFTDISNDVQEPAALNDTASHESTTAHINAEAEHKDLPEENESQCASGVTVIDAVSLKQIY